MPLSRPRALPLHTLATVVLFVCSASIALAQTETQAASDTSAASDTMRVRFIPGLGKLAEGIDSASFLHNSQFIWSGASTVGDLFSVQPGWFLRELGEPGQPSQLNFMGSDWRGVALLLDGRPLNDPITGTYDISDIPVEYIDHIEVFSGPRALAFGGNGTAATINIVTHQYNSVRPITKIRFLQGPYEHLLTDALYTQNVATGTNLMIGVQRQVTDGRFSNAVYDSWNVRTRLRYNISDRLNVSISDFYTKASTGMNGGVWYDSTRSIFEEGLATVRYPSAAENKSRHDLTGSIVARLWSDTLALSQLHIYHSWMDREFRDGMFATHETEGTYSWQMTGAKILQRQSGSFYSGILGAQIERREVVSSQVLTKRNHTHVSLFGDVQISALSPLSASISFRQDRINSVPLFSYGGEVGLSLATELRLFGSYAHISRFSPFYEQDWYVGFSFPPNRHERHWIYSAGVAWRSEHFNIEATAYRREIQNETRFGSLTYARRIGAFLETVPSAEVQGGTISSELRVWHFEARGHATFTEQSNASSYQVSLPRWTLYGELAYRAVLFKEKLDVRLGISGRYVGANPGVVYVPARSVFADHQRLPLGHFSTFDLFGVFKIGDAYINIKWENVPNINAMTTFAHPLLGRNFKLGVNWRFMD